MHRVMSFASVIEPALVRRLIERRSSALSHMPTLPAAFSTVLPSAQKVIAAARTAPLPAPRPVSRATTRPADIPKNKTPVSTTTLPQQLFCPVPAATTTATTAAVASVISINGAPPALWVVTAYFNPCKYANRNKNWNIFAAALMRQGVPLCTVEMVKRGEKSELGANPLATQQHPNKHYQNMHIVVESDSVLWAKELLLNMGVRALPPSCTLVCWADADLEWDKDDWATRVTRMMLAPNGPVVLQPFECGVNMKEGETYQADYASLSASELKGCLPFGKQYATRPMSYIYVNQNAFRYHAGFAWVIRRDIWAQMGGLLEICILGQADYMMACAFTHETVRDRGEVPDFWNEDGTFGWGAALLAHIRTWQRKVSKCVQGRLSFLPGVAVFHNWHGSHRYRKYETRGLVLGTFDPVKHLRKTDDGVFEFTDEAKKMGLPAAIEAYFKNRKEDGDKLSG